MATKANGKYHIAVDVSSSDFEKRFDFLYIEGAGALNVADVGGNERTINVPANFYYINGGTKVLNSGTTATGITAYNYSQDFDRT